MNRTTLIDLLLSLGFEVVGHGSSINRIKEHMNFSNGNISVNLTDDNEHIYIIKSARTYLSGRYNGCEQMHKVSIPNNIKDALEPYLLPEESIVTYVGWKYEPYIKRRLEAIRYNNKWCRKEHLLDCIVPESVVKEEYE